jgi:hypothetical protein
MDRVERATTEALRRSRHHHEADGLLGLGMFVDERTHALEVRFPGRRVGPLGFEEGEEILGGTHEEDGQRERDDVRSGPVRQMELHRHAPLVLGSIRPGRFPGPGREPNRHGDLFTLEMSGGAERRGFRRRPECSRAAGALRVHRSEARVHTVDRIHRVDDALGLVGHSASVRDALLGRMG